MEKLIIAVDCDDVMVETVPAIVDQYNSTYGTDIQLKDYYSTDPSIWGAADEDTAIARVNAYLETNEYQSLPPIVEAMRVLKYLSMTHKLHLVTGRADFLEVATKRWLDEHFPEVFTTTEFTNFIVPSEHAAKTRSKADVCEQLQADVLIDDHLHHARLVAAQGVEVLLFGDYPWNAVGPADEPLPDNILRVANWQAVQDYFDGRKSQP